MIESQMNMNIREWLSDVSRKLRELTRIESWPEEFAVIPIKKSPRSGLKRGGEECPSARLPASGREPGGPKI
jgi:hypothetical protein